MELIWLFVGAIVLVGAMWALNDAITKSPRGVDKDVDGEPDEPDGPAKDL